ncbi:MAG: FmdB family zinc ribbon protein [Acidimicrobiia bacterium]
MPTYEYVCKNCDETLEVFQSFADKPLKKHKECGGRLQKVFHARGIVFKGGGFYTTDNKPVAAAKNSESGSDKGSASEKKSTNKTPDKTSAKAGTSASASD